MRGRSHLTKVALLSVLEAASGCYRSHEIHVGVAVEVVRGKRSIADHFQAGPTPAIGARVVAERCSDGRREEATVGSDGRAWLPFSSIDCWTVTVVDSGPPIRALSVLEAPAPLPSPIFIDQEGPMPTIGVDTPLAGIVSGRAAPSDPVRVQARPKAFFTTGLGSSPELVTTTPSFSGAFLAGASIADAELLVQEFDPARNLVNGALVSLAGVDLQAIEVVLPSPPVAIERASLSFHMAPLPGYLPISADDVGGAAWSGHADGTAVRVGRMVASASAVDPEGLLFDVEWPGVAWSGGWFPQPTLGLGILPQDRSRGGLWGVVNGPLADGPHLDVPPITTAEVGGASLGTIHVAIGGPGHAGQLLLRPARDELAEWSRWRIYAGYEGVMSLDGLPPLPEGWDPVTLGFGDPVYLYAGVFAAAGTPEWAPPAGPDSWGWNLVVDTTLNVIPRDP